MGIKARLRMMKIFHKTDQIFGKVYLYGNLCFWVFIIKRLFKPIAKGWVNIT